MHRFAHSLVLALAAFGCRPGAPTPASGGREAPAVLPVARAALADCPKPAARPFEDPLVHKARAEGDAFIEILEVQQHGDRVLACTGTQGLTVWRHDASGAAVLLAEGIAPRGVAHEKYPRCQHLAVHEDGKRVAVTSRGDEVQPVPFVGVLDLSTIETPRTLASATGPASYEGVAFSGETLIVAAHQAGVIAMKPEGGRLVEVARFSDPDSDAWFPAITPGGFVVAEGETGLRTYASRGDGFSLRATVPLPGSSKHVEIRGTTAYVASSRGVSIVDVADLAAPKVLSSLETPGTALAVAAGKPGVLFVADWDAVRGYDVADPSQPRPLLAQTVPTEGSFSRVFAVDASTDGRVFAGEWQGLHVYEHVDAAPAPDLELVGTPVVAGRAVAGAPALAEITVRNAGAAPLTIPRVDRTDEALTISPLCTRLAPGASATLDLRIEPKDDTPFSGQLVVRSDDPDEGNVVIDVAANLKGKGVGDPVPAFDLLDLDGERWTPERLRGKVTLLAYFATF